MEGAGKNKIEKSLGRSLTNEELVLLYLSTPVSASAGKIKPFIHRFDHQRFKSLVLRHKLASAIYLSETFSMDDVPPKVRQVLKQPAENIMRRMLLLSNEIQQMAITFQAEGLQPVFLKGPALGIQLFGDVAKRYSVDIDLLVKKEALPFAHDVLLSMNYQPLKTEEGNKGWRRRLFSYAKKDWTYRKTNPGIPVELHYRLFPNITYEKKEKEFLLNGTEKMIFGTTDIAVLKPLEHFLFLCAHGSVHQWFQLFWLRDIAAFVHQEKINWYEAIKLADKTGLQRSMVLAVHLSHAVFGTALPKELAGFTKRKEQQFLFGACIKSIFQPIHETMARRVERMWYLSRLDGSLRYKFNTYLGAVGRYFLEG